MEKSTLEKQLLIMNDHVPKLLPLASSFYDVHQGLSKLTPADQSDKHVLATAFIYQNLGANIFCQMYWQRDFSTENNSAYITWRWHLHAVFSELQLIKCLQNLVFVNQKWVLQNSPTQLIGLIKVGLLNVHPVVNPSINTSINKFTSTPLNNINNNVNNNTDKVLEIEAKLPLNISLQTMQVFYGLCDQLCVT